MAKYYLKLTKVVVFSFMALFLTGQANATTEQATGTISSVFVYGNGMVLVTGFSFPNATCNNNGGFYIEGDNPKINQFLSVILSAQARKQPLTVIAKTDNCWYPELGSSTETTYMISQ